MLLHGARSRKTAFLVAWMVITMISIVASLVLGAFFLVMWGTVGEAEVNQVCYTSVVGAMTRFRSYFVRS